MKIDIPKFLFIYEQEQFKTLTESAQSGLESLLGYINDDDKITDPRWISYILATVFHECAGEWLPIAEYGKGKNYEYGKPDKVTGKTYYGRGFVQLTWAQNYKNLGEILRVDLYNNPDLAMQPDISYKIMSYGMRNGSYTGVSLKKYFNADKTDAINARRIINGTDKAEQIAKYYDKFMGILQEATA